LLHSVVYTRGGGSMGDFLSEGELQSIKAYRIIGQGRRQDAVEGSEVDSTIDKTNCRELTTFAAIFTLIGWVFGVMLAAGARCVHSDGGELCGVGGYSGGVAMLVFGGLGPFVLAATWISLIPGVGGGFDRVTHRGIAMILVLALIVMVGAGSACVHSHGESELCGPGGEGGGIAMVVLGLLPLMPALRLCNSKQHPLFY
jgi:hypothetical protein